MENVIELTNVWVSYPEETHNKESMGLFNKKRKYWALRDVSFDVKKGEVLGVIGRNGSGKSTLLKLLSGLILPDRGKITIRGKYPTLLSLGAGFQNELSGYENIYINGLLLGHKKKEIDILINDIIDFSELGNFIYKPVRTYSSGMKSRLSFSIAITLDPQMLLIDEVLGVGDAAFQNKCKRRILEKINDGRTVIVVSHSAGLIQSLCSRTVWLHMGEQKEVGETKEVIQHYNAFMKGSSV